MIDIETLRYPVGKFSSPSDIKSDNIQDWIQTLERLPGQMREAVMNLSEAQLNTPYREGGWTVRQVVHHVPDSHLNAYCRFKLALTEENPAIRPYMEDRWAELPDSKIAPVAASLELLEAIHNKWVMLLRYMRPEDFKKTFYHPESKVTRSLEVVLCLYDWHSRHHLAHITELKKRMGWS